MFRSFVCKEKALRVLEKAVTAFFARANELLSSADVPDLEAKSTALQSPVRYVLCRFGLRRSICMISQNR